MGLISRCWRGCRRWNRDLLTDFVFENGFDVTGTQTIAPIDAMNRATKQPEVCTGVAVNDAATLAAMPIPSGRPCPLRAATRPFQAAPAAPAMIEAGLCEQQRQLRLSSSRL